MYRIGIDLGGTGIKAGVIGDDFTMIAVTELPTEPQKGPEAVCARIAEAVKTVLKKAGIPLNNIAGIGACCPGTVDVHNGVVVYSNNLGWRDFPFGNYLAKLLGTPIYISNDANAAAFGEYCAGSVKGVDSTVIITLGTGVGSGIVINSRIVTGIRGGGAELGHMVIAESGRRCTCGRFGCWEAYCSATGLIAMTREEMEKSPGSFMWRVAEEEGKVSGKTAFIASRQGDQAGKRVVDAYIRYLACGITNVINILQPQVISIGGGISREGDALLVPLRELIPKDVYGGPAQMATELRICSLGNHAGIIGAAMTAQSG